VVFGTLLILVVIGEGSTYLPQFGPTPVFVASMQWVVIGLAILLFLWFRPEGVFPERVRQLRKRL
jgi:branched-chain amino acid transport system permease protein